MIARTASLALAVLAILGGLALAQDPKAAPKTPAPTATQAIPVPQPEVLLVLIRSALIGLEHANRTGNYTVLREIGGPALQQHSAAQLGAAFANLRAAKVNLLTAAILTPQITQQPKVTPEGLLQLVGFFPTQPQRIQFNIVYQAAGGEWRLAGLHVGLTAPPQAEAKTPPADPKAKAAPAKKDAAKK
jgi:hypothetical protein